MQLGATRDALIEAGASAAAADKAAEELAAYDNQIGSLRTEMTALRGEMSTLRWMVTTNIALTLAIIGKLFLGH